MGVGALGWHFSGYFTTLLLSEKCFQSVVEMYNVLHLNYGALKNGNYGWGGIHFSYPNHITIYGHFLSSSDVNYNFFSFYSNFQHFVHFFFHFVQFFNFFFILLPIFNVFSVRKKGWNFPQKGRIFRVQCCIWI